MQNEFFLDQMTPGQETIIYHCPENPRKGRVLRFTGFYFLLLSFLSLLLLISPAVFMELQYRLGMTKITEAQQPQEKTSLFGSLLWLSDKKLTSPPDWSFSLLIPKIGVNAQVIPNVNPNNKDEYDSALKIGVAHARGTSFPDKIGTTYLFGHSSNLLWDAKLPTFYLLKDLNKNDEIVVFYNNQRYLYKVIDKSIGDAQDVPAFISQTDKKILVLQTCWPPGTAWKRLFILAEPVSESADL